MPDADGLALADWHNFYGVIAGASATLIGAMFVVVSLGVGFLTPDREAAIRTFLTATVTHLGMALFLAALTMVPSLTPVRFGAIIGIAGLGGLAYSGWIAWNFDQHPGTVPSDRIWYAIFPLVGYGLLLATAGATWLALPIGFDLLALAVSCLVLAGIRNAWDMIVFLATRPRPPS